MHASLKLQIACLLSEGCLNMILRRLTSAHIQILHETYIASLGLMLQLAVHAMLPSTVQTERTIDPVCCCKP